MNLYQFHKLKDRSVEENWKLWEMQNIIAENYGLVIDYILHYEKACLPVYWF